MVGGFELLTNTMLLLSLEIILANALKLKVMSFVSIYICLILYCEEYKQVGIECIGFNPQAYKRLKLGHSKQKIMLCTLNNHVKSDPTYNPLILQVYYLTKLNTLIFMKILNSNKQHMCKYVRYLFYHQFSVQVQLGFLESL
jgi:hypothetical protein